MIMAKKKFSEMTDKDYASLIKSAPKDHPIYKRGFVIGGKVLKPSFKNNEDKPSGSEPKKSIDKESSADKK
jgi:hypothetical protein